MKEYDIYVINSTFCNACKPIKQCEGTVYGRKITSFAEGGKWATSSSPVPIFNCDSYKQLKYKLTIPEL